MEKKLQRQEKFESRSFRRRGAFEFAEEDEESLNELRALVERLEHDVSVAETEMLLAGDNDQLNAICTIHPGAGGTGVAGLGRDAAAHVPEVGRAARLQDRDSLITSRAKKRD